MRAVPFLLLGAALLPYVVGNVRAEHLIVPVLAALAVLRAHRIYPTTAWAVAGFVLGALATVFFSRFSYQTGAMGDPSSQFVRMMLPALMMIAFPSIVPQNESSTPAMARAMTIVGAVVALFTAASMTSGAIGNILTLWVRNDEGGTWLSSQDVGRYTGIFNQPIEAGIFYSVALFASIYVIKYTKMSRVLIFSSMAAICFGGIASLSKNFVVLGALLALIYAFTIRLIPRGFVIIVGLMVLAISPIIAQQMNLTYFDSLLYLYNEGGIFAALSAGRFGYSEGSVSILFESLLANGDWITGRGLGSQLPLDNAFLEYLYQGGIISLAGYVIALSTLTFYGWRHRAHRDGKLLLVLMVYIWLASTGGPTITASRAGVALLLLISCCLVSIRNTLKRLTLEMHVHGNVGVQTGSAPTRSSS